MKMRGPDSLVLKSLGTGDLLDAPGMALLVTPEATLAARIWSRTTRLQRRLVSTDITRGHAQVLEEAAKLLGSRETEVVSQGLKGAS